MKKPIKAIIYVKKNLIPNNMDGNAVAIQFQEIIEYAFKNDIEIIKCYCDVAQVGSEISPKLQKMINDIADDSIKPEIVICTEYNKFGRYNGLYHKVKEALDFKNIKMISVNNTDRAYFEQMNRMH